MLPLNGSAGLSPDDPLSAKKMRCRVTMCRHHQRCRRHHHSVAVDTTTLPQHKNTTIVMAHHNKHYRSDRGWPPPTPLPNLPRVNFNLHTVGSNKQ